MKPIKRVVYGALHKLGLAMSALAQYMDSDESNPSKFWFKVWEWGGWCEGAADDLCYDAKIGYLWEVKL